MLLLESNDFPLCWLLFFDIDRRRPALFFTGAFLRYMYGLCPAVYAPVSRVEY